MKVGGAVPGPSSGSGRRRRAAARPGSPPRQLAPQSNYSRFASTSCAKRRLSAERPVCELRIPYDSWPARSCLLPDRGGDAALKSGAERSALYATTSCKAQQLVLVPSAAAGGSAGLRWQLQQLPVRPARGLAFGWPGLFARGILELGFATRLPVRRVRRA